MPTYLISVLSILWLTIASPESESNREHITIDVFTTTSQPISWQPNSHASVAIHSLDGIARFSDQLSKGLVRDPELAKQQVLRRFKTLDKTQYEALRRSADALALALHLGVKRYPAIVLNSHWVVYGLLDVEAAMDRYRAWRLVTEQ